MALAEVDAENLTALLRIRQVDEKDFVEPALALQFRGQGREVVGGRGDEDRVFLFLHPGEKGTEEAPTQPASDSELDAPAKAFSISSIHRTTGEMASAVSKAWRRFFSDSPTYLSKSCAGSRRTRGSFHSRAIVLAARLFPHP